VKHESWLVLEAEPGAVIYAGFRRRVDADEVRRRAMDGTLPEILRTIPATAGAWLHLPSGTCHALGAGILVAEVQSPSDTTFRIFDWGRGGRALHLEPALACIDFSDEGPQPTDGVLLEAGPFRTRRLGRTAGFALELIGWTQDAELDLEGTDAPEVLLNLGPAGSIETSDGAADPVELPLDEGRTVVIPAAARRLRIRLPAGGRMLRVHGGVPEPERIA